MIPSTNCGDKRKTERQDIDLSDDEDDTMECSICSDNWTQTGTHRLVSLKCGHLYGEKCIIRWITKSKGPIARCPHCKQPIKTSDLRVVLPIKLGAQDTAQLERIKSEVMTTKAALAERRYQLDKALLALSMSRRELDKMKKAHQTVPLTDDDGNDGVALPPKPRRTLQHFRTEYLSTKDLSTRVMALNQDNQTIFASTKKNNSYGADLYNLDGRGRVAYLPIHAGAIRDIKCQGDLLLSCGHDKTMKLTSTKDQRVVNSITLEAPGWCCNFGSDKLLYCGLANTTTLIYDSRHTKLPLHRLQNREKTGMSPVYSLIPMTIGGKSMVLCGNLNNIYAWNLDADIQCHVIDIGHLEDIDFRPYSLTMNDGSLLISSRRHNLSKHVIGTVTDDYKMDISYTFGHPYEQKWVSRTVHYNQDDRSLICFSDDENGTLCVNDGMETKSFPMGERIFDVNYCSLGDGNKVVAALGSSKLQLYKFM